jgi:hypothetical protein
LLRVLQHLETRDGHCNRRLSDGVLSRRKNVLRRDVEDVVRSVRCAGSLSGASRSRLRAQTISSSVRMSGARARVIVGTHRVVVRGSTASMPAVASYGIISERPFPFHPILSGLELLTHYSACRCHFLQRFQAVSYSAPHLSMPLRLSSEYRTISSPDRSGPGASTALAVYGFRLVSEPSSYRGSAADWHRPCGH